MMMMIVMIEIVPHLVNVSRAKRACMMQFMKHAHPLLCRPLKTTMTITMMSMVERMMTVMLMMLIMIRMTIAIIIIIIIVIIIIITMMMMMMDDMEVSIDARSPTSATYLG